jgi:hypothetical protein
VLGTCRRLAWAGVRAAGAVGHARLAEPAVAVGPPLCRCRGDLEAFRGPAQGPVVLHDAAGQPQSSCLGQGCITVGHEGLSGRRCRCRNPHRARRPSPISRSLSRGVRHQPPWTGHLGRTTDRVRQLHCAPGRRSRGRAVGVRPIPADAPVAYEALVELLGDSRVFSVPFKDIWFAASVS